MKKLTKISPHLWFDHQAEEAVNFYTSIFKNSSIGRIGRYTEAGKEIHKRPAGSVMTIEFTLEGQDFLALNGGPVFTFNESISFLIHCDNQEEIDYYWNKLKEGGDPRSQQCGWLKDKFGLSWQVAPSFMAELLDNPDKNKVEKAMSAVLKMKKINIGELEAAIG